MKRTRSERRKFLRAALLFVFLSLLPASSDSAAEDPGREAAFRTVASFPHDPEAFTQGLFIRDGFLYESTGLYGKSSMRKTELATGRTLLKRDLPERYFGEGSTALGEKVYQLTWKSRKGFIYSKRTLERKGMFRYSTEGWGLTDDGELLIMSDGSEKLYFLSPEDFSVKKVLRVHGKNGEPVSRLNELEYAGGKVYCNIWGQDLIAVVNPENGSVERLINLGSLKKELSLPGRAEVLNGIAWNSSSGTFFVTGKYWSEIFEVEILPVPLKRERRRLKSSFFRVPVAQLDRAQDS